MRDAECDSGPEVSGGSSDGRAPVSGDERGRTPQQASRRSGGPGFDSPSPLTSPPDAAALAEHIRCTVPAMAPHIADRIADSLVEYLAAARAEAAGLRAAQLDVARRAKVSALRDFAAWAGKMDEASPVKGSAAFHHNSLVEACAAMADFYEQGRLDDRLAASLEVAP